MKKLNVKVITLGHIPARFDKKKITQWKSSLFEIDGEIDDYPLSCDSDIEDWAFSDVLMAEKIPQLDGHDFLIAITNIPLQDNWYTRRLGNNVVLFTYHEIKDFLIWSNIPIENALLRVLYAYSMVYVRMGGSIPDYDVVVGFTHDETKGCLFDMNGIKSDLVESCDRPIVCRDCEHKFTSKNISVNLISKIKNEIKRVRKPLYFRWVDFIKHHPIISLIISISSVISLGAISSLVATYIYEHLIK